MQVAAPNTLGASVGSINYGDVRVGDTASQPVTLTNLGGPGDPSITVNGTTIGGTDASSFSDNFNDANPVVLAPGESTTVNVSFNPTGATGAKAGEPPGRAHGGVNSPLSSPSPATRPPTTANQLGVSDERARLRRRHDGQTGERTLTLTNLGLAGDPSILVDATTITGTDAGQFSDLSTTRPTPRWRRASRSTSPSVSPRPRPATKTATLNVAHGGTNSPMQVSLDRQRTGQPPVNQAPTANAGADQTITLPAAATLAGSAERRRPPARRHADDDVAKFSGPGSVTFGNASALSTTASFSAAGTYVLRLTASDGALSTSDDVTIDVNPAGPGGGRSCTASRPAGTPWRTRPAGPPTPAPPPPRTPTPPPPAAARTRRRPRST